MSLNKLANKWGFAALTVVCIFLVIRLYSEISAPLVPSGRTVRKPAAKHEKLKQASGAKKPSGAPTAADDALLQLGLFKSIEASPLVQISRNPFDFGPVAPPVKTGSGSASLEAAAAPPPPPIPLKAFGFSVDGQGRRQAYLANANEVFVVTKGALVSKRFKVLDITPAMVEVEDAASHQKAELPIPQPR